MGLSLNRVLLNLLIPIRPLQCINPSSNSALCPSRYIICTCSTHIVHIINELEVNKQLHIYFSDNKKLSSRTTLHRHLY